INAIALYETQDPDASPFLQKDEGAELFRVYTCRHETDSTAGFNDVDGRDAGWRCGGHPLPA
ncbi:MAG TPA: hypothetical protein VFF06_33075, partial [Polyangia bacterium]|nr:hypothetical protein [Polyangia bacterium]